MQSLPVRHESRPTSVAHFVKWLGSVRAKVSRSGSNVLLAACLVAALQAGAQAGDPPTDDRASSFGFRALEIFKVEGTPRDLESADMNGDGLPDLVVANNTDGTIRIFFQKSADEKDKPSESESSGDANEIASDTRFRVEKIYTDKLVTALEIADFDGDEKLDIAYYSDPAELEILFQDKSWGVRKDKFPIRDGAQSPYALRSGDLDGDGRTDLVLLGDDETYLLHQKEKVGLGQPQVLHNAISGPSSIELADVNGDGRLDLFYIQPGNQEPVITRLQHADGFGTAVNSQLRPIQAWEFARFASVKDETSDPTLLFLLQANTRRVKAFRWEAQDAPGGLTRAHLVPHRGGSDPKAMRRVLTDVDGDGRTDVVTSYPDTAQIEVTFQGEKGSLAKTSSYPTLAGVNGLVALDVDGDGKSEILVSSEKEKALGLSHWKDGRLQIPETYQLGGTPHLIDASKTPGDSKKDQAYVVVGLEDSKYELRVLDLLADGVAKQAAKRDIPTEGSEPSAMRLLDIDGDAKTDALVFVPFSDPLVLCRRPATEKDGDFENIAEKAEFGLGQLAKLKPSALTLVSDANSKKSNLLISSGNYARLLGLDAKGRLRMVDQYSGRTSSSKIAASAVVDLDGDGKNEVLVVDNSSRSIDVLQKGEDGTYSVGRNVKIPKLTLQSVEIADMDGDGRRDVVLFGDGTTAILYAREKQDDFAEQFSFGLERKDLGRAQDLTVGDLNEDGSADVVLTTAPRYNLIFLDATTRKSESGEVESTSLANRAAFSIFEEKSYMRRSQTLGPQKMLIRDIDRDGLEDLVLLIHDRILLYLQDGGGDE